MRTVERFADLHIWQEARRLVSDVYALSERDGFDRDYALKDQIRRAAISVMSNIAEGFEGSTQKVFVDQLSRAKGSAGEVRSLLYVAADRGFLSDADFPAWNLRLEKLSRQIAALIRYLRSKPNARRIRDGRVIYHV